MIAASVLGVAITEEVASAARAFLGRDGPPTFDGALALAPLFVAAASQDTPFELALRCALGAPCARCNGPVEAGGEELDGGWTCGACMVPVRAARAFRRASFAWFCVKQVSLLDVGPPVRGRRRGATASILRNSATLRVEGGT